MLLSKVVVTHVSSIPLAVVPRQARASELAVVVPEGCGVVWSFIRAHQHRAGRHVAVYWDGTIRLDVGVELNGSLPDGGDIVRSATPAGLPPSDSPRASITQLGTAHRAIRDWCSGARAPAGGPNWEIYGHWQDEWNADRLRRFGPMSSTSWRRAGPRLANRSDKTPNECRRCSRDRHSSPGPVGPAGGAHVRSRAGLSSGQPGGRAEIPGI